MTADDVDADVDAAIEAAAQAKAAELLRERGPVPAELTERIAALLAPQTTRRTA